MGAYTWRMGHHKPPPRLREDMIGGGRDCGREEEGGSPCIDEGYERICYEIYVPKYIEKNGINAPSTSSHLVSFPFS